MAIQTYVVQGTDGRLYGPADVGTLNQWATEGRILADTVLIESGSNRQVLAKNLPGLQHHFQLHTNPRQQIGQPPYTPQSPQTPQAHQPQPGQTTHQPYQPGQPGYTPYKNPPSPYQGSQQHPGAYAGPRKNKIVAAVLAFVLGAFGVHRFYLGYTQIGIIMLVIGIVGYCLCGVGTVITAVWGIYEGIMILTDKMRDSSGQPLE